MIAPRKLRRAPMKVKISDQIKGVDHYSEFYAQLPGEVKFPAEEAINNLNLNTIRDVRNLLGRKNKDTDEEIIELLRYMCGRTYRTTKKLNTIKSSAISNFFYVCYYAEKKGFTIEYIAAIGMSNSIKR